MVRLTDRPDMTLDDYRGRKTTIQHQQQLQSTSAPDDVLIDSFVIFKSGISVILI